MRLSLPALVALAVLLPVAVIGCSGGSDAGSDGSGAPPANAAAVPKATQDEFANLPTGTVLKGVLAPKSFFPAGFAQDASTTADSHDAYQTPTTSAQAKPDCTLLSGTGWFTVTRVGEVSFAQTAYVDKNTNAELDQEVFAYSGTNAQAQLGDVGRLATLCPSYTDPQTHTKVKVTEHATTALGDGGYTITLTDPGWQTGSTLEAVRVGNEIAFVYSTSGPSNGAVEATRLTGYLVAKLTALR